MSAPHEKINFNLRPNKRIERRMVADVLSRLARYEDPSRFGYVGMGSYYFADFSVMHRVLGIDEMISIESDETNKTRFEFNKPLACITMAFGTTTEVLPTLQIFDERPVIVWLDYYGTLSDAVIGDIELVAAKCKAGSALLVTLNGSTPAAKDAALQKFEDSLSDRNRPHTYRLEDLRNPDAFAEMCRNALNMKLQSVCSDRNSGETRLSARQIFNFRYRDGARMLTFGWIFPDAHQEIQIDRDPKLLYAFPISMDDKPIDIDAPVLTFREIAHLRAQLPEKIDLKKFLQNAHPITKEAATQFAALYRYFPSFAHIEE